MRSRNTLKLAGLFVAVAVFAVVTAVALSEGPHVELSPQRNLETPNFRSTSLISDDMVSEQLFKSDGY
ncbi:DsbE family thiol:disulfide interchange protein, partial [Vibrio parahaemolyticus]|nr:DsbE family thiol:disulfide interchange protein [Vibrio parahaemolyticus]NMS53010.1 DsbE family thiol:disulfide interchange protein [Vibrio parahaemolyticus]